MTELKDKHKVRPRTDHEVPEMGKRFISTLSLTSALDRVGGQYHAPAALFPGKRHGSHWTGGFVGPKVGLEGAEYLAPTGIRSLDRPARSESLYPPNCPMIITLSYSLLFDETAVISKSIPYAYCKYSREITSSGLHLFTPLLIGKLHEKCMNK
jgi:hypothetical protein